VRLKALRRLCRCPPQHRVHHDFLVRPPLGPRRSRHRDHEPIRVGSGLQRECAILERACPGQRRTGFTDGARSFGGQFAYGAERGPFASVSLSAVDYDDIDESGTVVGISGGYAIPVTPSRKVELCPAVGFSRQTGPNVATEFGTADYSGRTFGFGATIGAIASSSPTFYFVPSVGGAYNSSEATFKLAGISGSSCSRRSIRAVI
jgi:hypothetical protein